MSFNLVPHWLRLVLWCGEQLRCSDGPAHKHYVNLYINCLDSDVRVVVQSTYTFQSMMSVLKRNLGTGGRYFNIVFSLNLDQIHPLGSTVCHSINILQTYFSVAYLWLYDLYPSLFLSSTGLLVSLCASVSACFAGDVSGSLSSWTNQHSLERGMTLLHFSLCRYSYIFKMILHDYVCAMGCHSLFVFVS